MTARAVVGFRRRIDRRVEYVGPVQLDAACAEAAAAFASWQQDVVRGIEALRGGAVPVLLRRASAAAESPTLPPAAAGGGDASGGTPVRSAAKRIRWTPEAAGGSGGSGTQQWQQQLWEPDWAAMRCVIAGCGREGRASGAADMDVDAAPGTTALQSLPVGFAEDDVVMTVHGALPFLISFPPIAQRTHRALKFFSSLFPA